MSHPTNDAAINAFLDMDGPTRLATFQFAVMHSLRAITEELERIAAALERAHPAPAERDYPAPR